ncbi:secretion protein HlyD [Ferrigenium kumadai]|uniref:Secretion protein HlyD n=1 Tax=Ferrigenium kumadai TaxID=1682490 RepID=A0AAN1W030_9PROT|nr:efflux RND transporter periplasmic adaptor subunit [Ferrigenium kumadai]BBI99186.1 secretion protein HlyD [Ferrigenium kumadai]
MALSQHRNRTAFFRYLSWAAGAVLLVLAIWFFSRPDALPVQLVKVERGAVEATVSNTRAGTVKACRRAKLAPPAGGQISQMRVKKGDRVKAGDVLLELWDEDLQAQERLAVQQLATAGTRADEVCTLAEVSRRDAVRARQLRERGFISPEGLDRAEADANAKQSSCASARSEIGQARSRIAVARAGLQRMVLRAPFDGIVADISGELGEYATPSPPGIPTPPAIDLIDDRCLFVSAPIDEVDAAQVKVGLPARITLDAIRGKSFAGKVKRIAPYVIDLEKQARTVEVEVEFNELPPDVALLVGYSADVEIVHTVRDKVLRIPTQTLLEGKRVLLYRPLDGMLSERTVQTGLNNWEYTEITSGLKEGDQIVLSLDQAGVKAGARVKPEAPTPAK